MPRAGSALRGVWAPPQVCLVPKALSPSVQFVQLKKGTVGAWSVSLTLNILIRRFCRLQMGVSCRECVGDLTWRPLQTQLGFGVQIWSNIGHCCVLMGSQFLSSAQEQIHGDFARPRPLQRSLVFVPTTCIYSSLPQCTPIVCSQYSSQSGPFKTTRWCHKPSSRLE